MDKWTKLMMYMGLALLVCLVGISETMAQTDFEIRIFEVENGILPTDYAQGLITITYTPGPTGTWLSVGATDWDTIEFGIIVSNAYLPPATEAGQRISITLPFNLSTLSAPGRDPVSKKAMAPKGSRTILETYIHVLESIGFYPFDPSTWITTVDVTVDVLLANTGSGPFTGEEPPEGTPEPPAEHPADDELIGGCFYGHVSLIDLDATANPASAEYAGDLNACTPAAVSNSIQWLDKFHCDRFDLPGEMSHPYLLGKLSGYMKRPAGEGVQTDEDFIRGKLDFFEEPGMPGADVKFQSQFIGDNVRSSSGLSVARNFKTRPDKKPTWDFFAKMSDQAEDVELGGVVRNKKTGQQFGHTVMAPGYYAYQSGIKIIIIADDINQKRTNPDDLITHMPLKVKQWDNGYMVLEMNDDLDFIITSVVAESPMPLDGRTTAAWLNELLAAPEGEQKQVGQSLFNETREFIEIALHESVTDLENYRIIFYDGATGLEYLSLTLDQFTPGDTVNGVTLYYYFFTGDQLQDSFGGVAVTWSGSVIQYQMHSYGGEFTALDGDATQMPTVDIGSAAPGQVFALAGHAGRYSGFAWSTTPTATPGALNEQQNITAAVPAVPQLTRPPDDTNHLQTRVRFCWDPADLADAYSLDVATDDQFQDVVHQQAGIMGTSVLVEGFAADTTYFWRVQAANASGPGPYSDIWKFSITLDGAVGDLNDDALVNVMDLLILQHFLAGNFSPGTAPFSAPWGRADISADGCVDAADNLSLANYLVEIPH
ncbi:MAG: hypothetical protein JXQ27_10960 [Acidobacteria bacterium]|nr:hypothetical protein [Acidobacteriota bacterium]